MTQKMNALTGRYQKLSQDLAAAVDAAKKAAYGDDGGTCNFDSLMLYLPRWKEDRIEAAAKAAGVRSIKTSRFRTVVYLFTVPCGGQGNARTRQAEAMADVMKAAGYDAGVWYQMD